MDVASRLLRGTIALVLTCVPLPCFGGEKEQVELLEQTAAQFESLSTATSEYSTLLERVTDSQSADSIVDQLEPATKKFIAELEKTQDLIQRGEREAKSGQIQSKEYVARAQAVVQKQPALIEAWLTQGSRFAKQAQRVGRLSGLSDRFRTTFGTQVGLAVGTMKKMIQETIIPEDGAGPSPSGPGPRQRSAAVPDAHGSIDTTPGGASRGSSGSP
jgi:hypothetical protein